MERIADALQLVGNAKHPGHLAQVDRDGLAAGDGDNGLFLDLAPRRVALIVRRR